MSEDHTSGVSYSTHPLDYYAIEEQIKYLMGEILTFIDATHSDIDQRKAQKDIVKNYFYQRLNFIKTLYFGEHASLASRD